MSDAPERIFMGAENDDGEVEIWFDPDEGGTEYVRADLHAALEAEVARLTKKVDRALKGRAASRESERAAWAATEALRTEVARLREALEASA